MRHRRAIVFVFLPFVAGFYLSYLFRTINALIADLLTSDLALTAADLGLLTSLYFFTFAAIQLPLGVWLDRYGPRRVQGALLLVAALGAAVFGWAERLAPLVIGRALIGLGVAGALMAGLKAIVPWFPRERVALVNGWFVTIGALGAVTATAPAEWLIHSVGWRGLFQVLALTTVVCAVVIYVVVPEAPARHRSSDPARSIALKQIYSDPRFWQLAPLSATCIGTSWALPGLWAASWLADVEAFERSSVVRHLFVMAVALCLAALGLGIAADRLRRRCVHPATLLGFAATVFIAAQFSLVLRWPLSSYLIWSIIAGFGAATVLSYAILAEYFPKQATGRANGALNTFHFGVAFIVQWAIGAIVQQWPSHDGRYPAIAYQVALALNLALQLLALLWFVSSRRLPGRRAQSLQALRRVGSMHLARAMADQGAVRSLTLEFALQAACILRFVRRSHIAPQSLPTLHVLRLAACGDTPGVIAKPAVSKLRPDDLALRVFRLPHQRVPPLPMPALKVLRLVISSDDMLRTAATHLGMPRQDLLNVFEGGTPAHWRLAALGSATLCCLLTMSLAAVVRGADANVARARDAIIVAAMPPDSQIEVFLAHFIEHSRSLSSDPIVVRSNWRKAHAYLTGRGANILNDFARKVAPFTIAGIRAVSVETTSSVRISSDSFAVRWVEHSSAHGVRVATEEFVGRFSLVSCPPNSQEALLLNPLGLCIDAISWGHENHTRQ